METLCKKSFLSQLWPEAWPSSLSFLAQARAFSLFLSLSPPLSWSSGQSFGSVRGFIGVIKAQRKCNCKDLWNYLAANGPAEILDRVVVLLILLN